MKSWPIYGIKVSEEIFQELADHDGHEIKLLALLGNPDELVLYCEDCGRELWTWR